MTIGMLLGRALAVLREGFANWTIRLLPGRAVVTTFADTSGATINGQAIGAFGPPGQARLFTAAYLARWPETRDRSVRPPGAASDPGHGPVASAADTGAAATSAAPKAQVDRDATSAQDTAPHSASLSHDPPDTPVAARRASSPPAGKVVPATDTSTAGADRQAAAATKSDGPETEFDPATPLLRTGITPRRGTASPVAVERRPLSVSSRRTEQGTESDLATGDAPPAAQIGGPPDPGSHDVRPKASRKSADREADRPGGPALPDAAKRDADSAGTEPEGLGESDTEHDNDIDAQPPAQDWDLGEP